MEGYRAYCFDEAVIEFGSWVESEIEQATAGAKNQGEAQLAYERVITTIFSTSITPKKQQFANPVATKK